MDLDFWDCFGRKKLSLITEETWYMWIVHYQVKLVCQFHFCLSSNEYQVLKGKNLLCLEQIFRFRSIPHFGRTNLSREAYKRLHGLFLFVNVEKYGGVLTLNRQGFP